MEAILRNISNNSTGESFQLYDRGIFVTPYLKNSTQNSFAILGEEYYNQDITEPSVSVDDTTRKLIDDYINKPEKSFLSKELNKLYPFAISDWVKKELPPQDAINLFETYQVMTYSKDDKKLFSNVLDISNDDQSLRPFTNYSIEISNFPNIDITQNPSTINGNNLKTFFNNRYLDPKTEIGQSFTEGKITYKNYDNQLTATQTTSMLNTPYFVNAIQMATKNLLLGNSNKNLPPYVSAAYLFINSLPLSTLKEKYTELVNGVDILDLSYLFACFKKNSALHKLPYAWVLKIGSIWNRYKVWKEKNFDYLEEIWKDFDYMKNFDPENKNVLNYDLGSTNVIIQGSTSPNNLEVGLGFYPETISYFDIFLNSQQPFTGYTEQEIKKSFDDKLLTLINGSYSANKIYGKGYNLANNAETLTVKSYRVVSNTGNGFYIIPSFN
jgi:hypothetical protein